MKADEFGLGELHFDWHGSRKALCDGEPLDAVLNESSPECRDLPVCPICWIVVQHLRREARRHSALRRVVKHS